MREWFKISCKADDTVAELSIYGEIGPSFFGEDAVTAKAFMDGLQALPERVKTLRVHVNSTGGSVFEAIPIANRLRAESREHRRTVEIIVDGLAASAATLITSAGDSIRLGENCWMMIHNPMGGALGPAKTMREMADLLDNVRDGIIDTYRWVSPLSREQLSDMMDASTWMRGEEAVKNGFATEVVPGVEVTARFDPTALDRLGHVPAGVRAHLDEWATTGPKPKPLPDPDDDPKAKKADAGFVLRACAELGDHYSPKLATALLEYTEPEVTKRIAHAKEVTALCATAKLPELAEGYVLAHTPVATVQAHLTVVTAKLDQIEIDTRHSGDEKPAAKVRISSTAIYAARRPQPALGAGR